MLVHTNPSMMYYHFKFDLNKTIYSLIFLVSFYDFIFNFDQSGLAPEGCWGLGNPYHCTEVV